MSATGSTPGGPAEIDDRVEVDEHPDAVGLRVELDDVEVALERLDAGTYGTCQICGVTLLETELEHRPQARLCPDHSG